MALDGNEIEISVERKKRRKAKERLIEIEKRVKREVIEGRWLSVVAFKAFEQCTNMKVQFAAQAFVTSQVECCKRVTRYFPNLDLSFLDKNKSKFEEDQSMVKSRSTGIDSTYTATTEDASQYEATPILKT